jgi:hypothetical protein
MPPPDARPHRRSSSALLVALFVAGMLLPALEWKFHLDAGARLTENRELAPAPTWPRTWDAALQFPRAFDAYWNDAFGFRPRLIRWHAIARYELGVSPTPLVIPGKDGWLFYAVDGKTDWFRGVSRLPEARLARWKTHLEARRDWLARRGIRFLYVITPDKETIYPELVPARYARLTETAVGQLVDYMRANSTVEIVDLRPALLAAKPAETLYSRTDTHWNHQGAFAGYAEIMRRLKAWFPDLTPRARGDFVLRQGPPWSGDLAAMMGLVEFLAEPRPELVPVPPYTSRPSARRGSPPRDTVRYAAMEGPSPARPRAVVFHDSFFLPPEQRADPKKPLRTDAFMPSDTPFRLVDLFAEQFSRSVFTWQHTFDPQLVEREHPDVVIEEEVERMLQYDPSGALPR